MSDQCVSSKSYCEEKFSCDGDYVEAEYECGECGTLQCSACESSMHELSKFVFHDRRRIQLPPQDQLCQLSCADRNFADVKCEDCHLQFCSDCFEKIHSNSKRKDHVTQELQYALQRRNMKQVLKSKHQDESSSREAPCISFSNENYMSGRSSLSDHDSIRSLPDIAAETGSVLSSSPVRQDQTPEIEVKRLEDDIDEEIYKDCKSFELTDQAEKLQVANEAEFLEKLGCDDTTLVKVVSIFGNTGDGKSHTLNHTFFGGREVFKTSAEQTSCTIGAWAAFDPVHNAIVVDTEGMLGVTSNPNQRTRLLLKVLAISDVVIYRSKADRLHTDMFQFLGDASKAYLKHFTDELRAASKRNKMDLPLSNLGPGVLIFHETTHTDILGKGSPSESADTYLRKRFQDLALSIDAFSALQYVGTRTRNGPTDFNCLLLAVKAQMRNTAVRSHRRPTVVFKALKVLNEKFNGDIEKSVPSTFPDQYFTCNSSCLSCGSRCSQTMNHIQDDIPHSTESRCKYQHQFDNKIFFCKACYNRGQDVLVVPKTSSSKDTSWFGLATYAWSGFVLECPNCGVIYRSRQYWYGNQDPEKSVVRTEIRHVWPDGNPVLQGTHNAGRRLLDSLNYAGEVINSISAKPTKVVSNWITDQIAPPYWVPNAIITHCKGCSTEFHSGLPIHHCRACGQGFCDDCSLKKRPCPERGWGMDPVRVCNGCYSTPSTPGNTVSVSKSANGGDGSQLTARKVGEVIGSTFGVVASAMEYPLDMLRESARPAYWVPDNQIKSCIVCNLDFNYKLKLHHCRACGQGVCDPCSQTRRSVPSRGWDDPTRVCDICAKKSGNL